MAKKCFESEACKNESQTARRTSGRGFEDVGRKELERIDAARQRRGAKHPSTLMQEVIWSVSGISDDDDDDDGMLHAFSKSVIDKLECGFASIVCHVIGTHVPPDPKHWGASFGVFCSNSCSSSASASAASSSSSFLLPPCFLPRQSASPILSGQLRIAVCTPGPQPQGSPRSVHPWTSTARIRTQCASLDLNRKDPIAVCTPGPQPQGSDRSVHRWTSTARIRSQCAPLDLNQIVCQIKSTNTQPQTQSQTQSQTHNYKHNYKDTITNT